MTENTSLARSDSRWIPFVSLYVVAAVWAVVQLFWGGNGGVYLLFWLAFAIPATTWVVMDGRHRNKPILHILQFVIFFTWPIAVPVYLVATRGIYGIGLTTLHVIGLIVVTCVFSYGAILLVWGPGVLTGQ